MSTQIQRRRGTTAEHSTFTGVEGELTVDTTKDTVVVHDGATTGGRPLLREDQANLPSSVTNGISVPSTNTVALSTNGTGRLFVDASGNVGVNTTPEASTGRTVLTLNGTSGDEIRLNTNGTQSLALITASGVGIVRAPEATGYLRFDTGGATERLRITSAGLVGIGTSSPGSALDLGSGVQGRAISWHTTSAAAQGAIWTNYSTADLTLGRNLIGSTSATAFLSSNSNNVGKTAVQLTSGSFVVYTDPASTVTYGAEFTPTPRFTINSSGSVGIGTTSPAALLHVQDAGVAALIVANTSNSSGVELVATGTTGEGIIRSRFNNSQLLFGTAGASGGSQERARIDTSGRFLVGTSSSRASRIYYPGGNSALASTEQIEGIGSTGSLQIVNNQAGTIGSSLVLGKSRGTAVGSVAAVASGDQLGTIQFNGIDVTTTGDLQSCAGSIACEVDGTPGANDMPGRLVFSTTADGASSPTERLRITSAGVLQVADAGNIAVGTTTGTKIGTATTQKLGFFNKTPVVQPAAVADATDAASVITQLNALLARMRDLGLIAT